MRNYQRKKNNPYQLPHNVYMQCLYAIRDYDRVQREIKDLIEESPKPHDGMPRGSGVSDPTLSKAIKIEGLNRNCGAVERALSCIPKEYQRGVWNNIVYGAGLPIDAHPQTYYHWRQVMIYKVAEHKGFL